MSSTELEPECRLGALMPSDLVKTQWEGGRGVYCAGRRAGACQKHDAPRARLHFSAGDALRFQNKKMDRNVCGRRGIRGMDRENSLGAISTLSYLSLSGL